MTLTDLAALFASPAMAEPYGEDMAIGEHMLQCAELAADQGLGEHLVAAALLHDIGWALGGDDADHAARAARALRPQFGPRVTAPIAWHIAAKRFLVATDAHYAARLSACSRATLAAQGGPYSPRQCAAFARLPAFADAVALRRIDDAGKADRASPRRFEDYLPLLRRVM